MIGLLLGIAPVALLPQLPGVWVAPALAVLAVATRLCPGRAAGLVSGVCAGAALALANGAAHQAHRLPAHCETRPLSLEGLVDSLPRRTAMPSGELRQRFEFRVQSVTPADCAGPRRVLLSRYTQERLEAGQRWRFPVRLRRPWGLANPGSFNMQAWFAQTGIDAVGSVRVRGAYPLPATPGVASLHHRLRERISTRLHSLPMDADANAILRALTVADRSGLDHRLFSLLQTFGVNHLVVISGLHIGMLAGLGLALGSLAQRLQWSAGLARRPGRWPAVLALSAAAGYAALAGFSLPTTRALVMLACVLLAGVVGRRSSPGSGLLLAACVVLALNPLAVLGSGFWLSFGAVSALLWLGAVRPVTGLWARLGSAHGYMALVMLPLGGFWFGGASAVAALANLVLVPLVGLWVVPLALLGGLLAILGSPLDRLAWQGAALPLEYLLPPARQLVASGAGWLYTHLVPDLGAALLAVPATALLAARVRPGLKLLAACLLLPLLLPGRALTGDRAAALQVTVLDVGQGTSVLLRQGPRALLYDTGGGDPAGANLARMVVLPYLRLRGVSALDSLLLSHPDRDHSAGAGAVLQSMPVGEVWFSGGPPPRADARRCRAGVAWRWPGGARLQLLAPAGEAGLSSNDGSCVLQVEYAGHRLLLPGDIGADRERMLLRYWRDHLRSDWLLVGHHGSASSSSRSWLKTVQPRLAVFSHGYRNRFGHPHPDVVQRLRQQGVQSFHTSRRGALEFTFLSGKVQVRGRRDGRRRWWM